MQFMLMGLLILYRRYMSPYLGGGCRFKPSCSEYALECVRRHGATVGTRLTVARLARCQPDYPCGSDPVPKPGQIEAALAGDLLVAESPTRCAKAAFGQRGDAAAVLRPRGESGRFKAASPNVAPVKDPDVTEIRFPLPSGG